MSRIVNASFYMAPGEKYNHQTSSQIRVKCHECNGTGRIYNRYQDVMINCTKCHADGWLTNQLSARPDLPICASNEFRKGWLRVKIASERNHSLCQFNRNGKGCIFPDCAFKDEILVLNCDTMATWLNSENGKYNLVCNTCHSKFIDANHASDCPCCDKFRPIRTRDLDISYSAFGQLAPHSVGLIKVEVEEI